MRMMSCLHEDLAIRTTYTLSSPKSKRQEQTQANIVTLAIFKLKPLDFNLMNGSLLSLNRDSNGAKESQELSDTT